MGIGMGIGKGGDILTWCSSWQSISCSVLVHSGGVHGGHYYAFIRPTLSDQWYVYYLFYLWLALFSYNNSRFLGLSWPCLGCRLLLLLLELASCCLQLDSFAWLSTSEHMHYLLAVIPGWSNFWWFGIVLEELISFLAVMHVSQQCSFDYFCPYNVEGNLCLKTNVSAVNWY
jgi:hypothetical protein